MHGGHLKLAMYQGRSKDESYCAKRGIQTPTKTLDAPQQHTQMLHLHAGAIKRIRKNVRRKHTRRKSRVHSETQLAWT